MKTTYKITLGPNDLKTRLKQTDEVEINFEDGVNIPSIRINRKSKNVIIGEGKDRKIYYYGEFAPQGKPPVIPPPTKHRHDLPEEKPLVRKRGNSMTIEGVKWKKIQNPKEAMDMSALDITQLMSIPSANKFGKNFSNFLQKNNIKKDIDNATFWELGLYYSKNRSEFFKQFGSPKKQTTQRKHELVDRIFENIKDLLEERAAGLV